MLILDSSVVVLHCSTVPTNYMPRQVDNSQPSGADIRFSSSVLQSCSDLANNMPKQVDNLWPSGADIRFFSCILDKHHILLSIHMEKEDILSSY